jgi:hypothetical protein
MKNYLSLVIIFSITLINACVQPSSKKTVVVRLNVQGQKDIKTVGIRGGEKPLSWDADLALKPIKVDSLYECTFTILTGYKFTEAKFTVNGNFELNDQPNRRIVFSQKDSTIYTATFDVGK